MDNELDQILSQHSRSLEKSDPNLVNKMMELINEREKVGINEEETKKDILNNISDEQLKNFKKDVYQYSELDNLISLLSKQLEPFKPIQDRIKVLKKEKLTIEKEIAKFMKNNVVTYCNLPNRAVDDSKGALVCSERNIKPVMTEKLIKERILKFFKNEDMGSFNSLSSDEKADALHKYIYVNVQKICKPVVKRVAYVCLDTKIDRTVGDDNDE